MKTAAKRVVGAAAATSPANAAPRRRLRGVCLICGWPARYAYCFACSWVAELDQIRGAPARSSARPGNPRAG